VNDKIVKSACGAARLAAAILGEDSRDLQRRLGLRDAGPLCPVCDGPIPFNQRTRRYNLFCSPVCQHRWFWPLVECEECHKLKEVPQKTITRANPHPEHFFCSHKCKGAYLGRTYGFGAHPEQAGRCGKLTGPGACKPVEDVLS